jgi:hypothetical protein
MKIAVASLSSVSPYSQSRMIDPLEHPKKDKETNPAYEERTWKHHMHVSRDGHVEIPGPCFAAALKEAAKRLKLQIPGKGRVEYTKYFEAGVMCVEPLVLPILSKDVKGERLHLDAQGRPGGGKRVWKTYPRIDEWQGDVTFLVFDDTITEDVFRQVLVASGTIVGIGRFRPEKRGFYGRFQVNGLKWLEREGVAAE